jgi:OHCU decarboxylase
MTMAEINALTLPHFVDLLGEIYEHSPWVADRVWHKRPFQSSEELRGLMKLEVEAANREQQLSLLRAHPDLGTRAKVGEFSSNEQKRAGLDQLTTDEYETLLQFNRQYRDRFGFPFIYAVRGSDKRDILTALMIRSESGLEDEFAQALREVHRIAGFRLEDLIRKQ